jgi:hypothetical protein
MTKETFKKLTRDYPDAEQAHTYYVEQFLTTIRDDIEMSRATKALTSEEIEKIKDLKEKADKAHEV